MFYKTLNDLLEDYEQVAYRPAKKGELIITTPNMFTGKDENVLSVSKCSSDMKYCYARIVKKKKNKKRLTKTDKEPKIVACD